MENEHPVWKAVDALSGDFIQLSDRIWGEPEVAFGEFRAVERHAEVLEAQGFRVTRGVGGLPTALMAEAGEGGPVIAFLGEYDALPGLSQEADLDHEQPVEAGGPGHGCGHNMLGTSALLAATALKSWLAATGRPGRVRYYGCPAEEGGGGKVFMARAGAFDGCDVAITWHPDTTTRVDPGMSLANRRILFRFTGRASHAAVAPQFGRSALDAVELMNVGVNYLREHMPSDARIHYAMIDGGGTAANVVQAKAAVRYAVRARTRPELDDLMRRVEKVAEGAALMTETQVEWRIESGYSDLLPNRPLREITHRNMARLGPVPFDDADRAFAAAINATLSPDYITADFQSIGREVDPGAVLFEDIVGLDEPVAQRMSSTDVADVSWIVPTVELRVATWALGTQAHTWQVVAQGKSGIAHKGLVHAAKIMAATGAELVEDGATLAEAKSVLRRQLERTPYASPIPDSVLPPVQPAPAG